MTRAEQRQDEQTLYRDFALSRASISEEDRTVELSFSSEEPYERWFGNEILDHGSSSVRLGRLLDGGPLLLDHDRRQHIGVVKDVSISTDRRGKAVVRFGKSARAQEIFDDVKDGIRSKVSVGYIVHKMVLEGKADGVETWRVTDWEPLEISVVAIPADPTVGVGRALEPLIKQARERTMNAKTPEQIAAEQDVAVRARESTPAPQAQPPPANVRELEDRGRNSERERTNDLIALGNSYERFGGKELALKFIVEGKSVTELQAALLERANQGGATRTAERQDANIGLTDKEKENFSFVRLLNALANPGSREAQQRAAFELECSAAAAKKSEKAEIRGCMVPEDVLRHQTRASLPRHMFERAMSVGNFGSAGSLVDTDLLTGSFIDLLRNRMIAQAMGATILTGLVGNIEIPRQKTGSNVYWVGEDEDATESAATFDQVTMSPKTVAGFTDLTRKLMIQSSLDVENMVRNDLSLAIALEIDRVCFYGKGTDKQPLGLKYTTGVQTKDFAGAAPTFAEIVDMETKVAAVNADIGTLAYATNATMRGTLKTTQKVSGQETMLWQGGEMNGYRAEASNQIETGDIWFGNYADLLIGFWSGLDLTVDLAAKAKSGGVRVIGFQDVDTAVRRPVSFVRGNNTL